jgi:hypothetical protein
MTRQGPVFIWTNPSDVQCIQHQQGIIMHIELYNYVNSDGDTFVDYLYLYMKYNKIILHDRVQ